MSARRALLVAIAGLLGTALAVVTRAEAASLAGVRERGALNVCAHPDALPYSSQDRTIPGFQLELAEAIAKRLGVKLHVDWIVFTRHARRLDCDATMGSIVKLDADDGAPTRGPRLTKPYTATGYVLVVPARSSAQRFEDVKGKIGVEHTSWPHYVLDTRKVPLASYGGPFDLLDAVTNGEVPAGIVSAAYAGWYIKLNPGTVKMANGYVPDRDFQWNVAIALRNADAALVDAVNQALDALTADGTVATIFARYGFPYRAPIAR
ncbi:MAG TPA: transporter substrate-binding domain-containing protein [Methylomirabilota bacterium]|jgi:polar amino acid transport system substrate-binding protein